MEIGFMSQLVSKYLYKIVFVCIIKKKLRKYCYFSACRMKVFIAVATYTKMFAFGRSIFCLNGRAISHAKVNKQKNVRKFITHEFRYTARNDKSITQEIMK